MFLAQPAPQPIPDVVIHAVERVFGAVAVAVETPPAEQHGVEGIDDFLELEVEIPSGGHLLDSIAEILDLLLRDLDPGPVAPATIPAETDTMPEEHEALGERRDIRFLWREREKTLEGLVAASGGSELNALRAVKAAANQALAEGRLAAGPNGILPGNGMGAVLEVNGVSVQLIGGRVMSGVVELGSFCGL